MSDTGRKDFTDKVQDKVTPDSSKSTTEHVKDTITGTSDHAARDIVPDSEKSTSQSLGDKVSREKDHQQSDTTSTIDKVKHGLGMDKH